MWGVGFLIGAIYLGWLLLSRYAPDTKTDSLPTWFWKLPGAWCVGIVSFTCLSYLLSAILIGFSVQDAMTVGPQLALILGLVATKFLWWRWPKDLPNPLAFQCIRLQGPWLSLTLAFLGFSAVLLCTSVYQQGTDLLVSDAIYSDLGAHLPMVRSFSMGANIPTQYVHYAGPPIQLHFLFDYLAGVLERLGLPLAWAYNLPSILSLMSMLMLLSAVFQRLFNSVATTILALGLFLFRSSLLVWPALLGQGWLNLPEAAATLWKQDYYLALTQSGQWGLWTMHVFVNQRHLSLGLALLFLALYLALPWLKAPKEKPARPMYAVWLGILLGLGSYFNGAMALAGLLMAVPALFNPAWRKPVAWFAGALLVTMALCTLAISGGHPSGFHPQFHFGLLSPNHSLPGVAFYALMTFGLSPWLAWGLGSWLWPQTRWLLLCISVPLLSCFLIQWTPDVAANHKLATLSIMLLNGWVAACLVYWLQRPFATPTRRVVAHAGALCLTGALMLTGCFDWAQLTRQLSHHTRISLSHPQLQWALKHSAPNSVWLVEPRVFHPVSLSGRRLYLGWPYFAQTAGYAIEPRVNTVHAWLVEPESAPLPPTDIPIEYVVFDRSFLHTGSGIHRIDPAKPKDESPL